LTFRRLTGKELQKLRYVTAGESHGQAVIAVLEGLPAGLKITEEDFNNELSERQVGYGRGKRMQIESDRARVISGLRFGLTMGSPLTLLIENKDWPNWQDAMGEFSPSEGDPRRITRPRPGHADLAGLLKYGTHDARNILERSSARETAARVAAGAAAKKLLRQFEIEIVSHVIEIGGIQAEVEKLGSEEIRKRAGNSQLRCADERAEAAMIERIDRAKEEGDTLGGMIEVVSSNVPPGLGSHVQWDRKLDGLLAQAVMSIQAVKSVEIGLGSQVAKMPGSKVHDEIFYDKESRRFYRGSNRAGGIEGGISNGSDIILKAAMKPIPTLRIPLASVDVETKAETKAVFERSDVCAVSACAVVAASVVALTLADQMIVKFGGDSVDEMKANYKNYVNSVEAF
jgi:chorismate synthase